MVAQLRLSNPHVFLSVAVWKTRPQFSRPHSVPSLSPPLSFFPFSPSSSTLPHLSRFPCSDFFSTAALFFFTFVLLQTRLSFPQGFPLAEVLLLSVHRSCRVASRRFRERFIRSRLHGCPGASRLSKSTLIFPELCNEFQERFPSR